ncbi:MAG: hypothetical protein AAFQ05_01435 [Pseudomonadota bacterium]
MSFFNPFAIGFVCVAAGAVVGVDYVLQSKANGSNPGEYSFSAYLGNYGLRVDDTIASIDKARRQSVEARTHLPMEPVGWERLDWDIGAIDMDAVTQGMDIVQSMAAKKERTKAIALANYEAWEYRQGDSVVRISATFSEELAPSATAISGQLTGTFFPVDRPQYRLYKIVGDVPFLAVTDKRQPKKVKQTLLEARLGNEILIAVAADTDMTTLMPLLEQIDFASLNMMMSEPLPYLGEGARRLNDAQLMTLAGVQARALNSGEDVPPELMEAIVAGTFVDVPQEEVVAAAEPTVEPAGEPAVAAVEPEEEKPAAGRLQLSGGRSCLGEDTRLCD